MFIKRSLLLLNLLLIYYYIYMIYITRHFNKVLKEHNACMYVGSRFAGSNLTEIDGYFQDTKVLNKTHPG